MTEDKRFTDNGIEDIENQSFTDNLTGKTYWIDNGLDEIVNLLNTFNDENEQLKRPIKNLQNELSTYSEIFNELNGLVDENKLLKSYNGEMEDYLARLEEKNEKLKEENKKLICIIKQLEAKYEDKGFSLAYDMGECE